MKASEPRTEAGWELVAVLVDDGYAESDVYAWVQAIENHGYALGSVDLARALRKSGCDHVSPEALECDIAELEAETRRRALR